MMENYRHQIGYILIGTTALDEAELYKFAIENIW
jgi:hypothetical protein